MANKAVSTKAPSGLSITRDGGKFTISWKISDSDYGAGQWIGYKRTGDKKWTIAEIGKKTTTKSYSFPAANWYPVTSQKLTSVNFAIKGKRATYKSKDEKTTYVPAVSDWTKKTFTVSPPGKPTLSATLSSSQSNVCTFKWELDASDSSKQWFYDVQWQTMLVQGKETDGSKLTWKSAKGNYWDSGTSRNNKSSKDITENTNIIAQIKTVSYTRWFRIRARGPAGVSDWRYAKHVYATPKIATITKKSASNNNTNGINAYLKWTAGRNAAYPIDNTYCEYVITVPDVGVTCPAGASWQTADTTKDTAAADAASWVIDNRLKADECLFGRIVTQHDNNKSYSKAALMLKGKLSTPTGLSVTLNTSTNKAIVNATNNSNVSDSFLVIKYSSSLDPKTEKEIGIIEHGKTSATIQCPDLTKAKTVTFKVYACVGKYILKTTDKEGVKYYAVSKSMISDDSDSWNSGKMASPPKNITIETTDVIGTVRVSWETTWEDATNTIISWAQDENAWESTEEPSSYTIDDALIQSWLVTGLEQGKEYYFKMRSTAGEDEKSAWSEAQTIDLASPPVKPVLTLSSAIIKPTDNFWASWEYISTDTTEQIYAELVDLIDEDEDMSFQDFIAHAETTQSVMINKAEEWEAGSIHNITMRVKSESGYFSEWSDTVPITVAEEVTAEISAISLSDVQVPEDDEEGTVRTVRALNAMPLSVTVTGAGEGGTTSIVIERAEDYHMDRPDEKRFDGFEGECIASYSQTGEAEIIIDQSDLVGLLDDGAKYRLIATVQDGFGQSDETTEEFEVRWAHQALVPVATEELRGNISLITPNAPDGTVAGDVCDIYRLSADRPELIVENGTFGETYVDPYPAIGEFGGHRIVFKTLNGDYITEDNMPAWVDTESGLESRSAIIDFDGEQIFMTYNLEQSNNWSKNFIETKYLGGAVQGDWNLATDRSLSLSAMMIVAEDQEMIKALRKLAIYTGICHVRTVDGSSFAADVQVSERRSHTQAGRCAEFSLTITRVDPEGMDGVTLEQWYEEGTE